MIRLAIPTPWREAVALSLLCNLVLFGLTAGITERKKGGEVVYIPIDLIQYPGDVKQITLPAPPSARPQVVEQPPQEVKKEQPTEKELGLDKKGAEPAPAAPPTQTAYQPSHVITRVPYFKTQIKPAYPQSERAAGKEARVIVEVFISEYGKVDDARIVKSGGPLFDEAVLKAVLGSTFNPGYLEGRPVAVRVQIPYVFKLR